MSDFTQPALGATASVSRARIARLTLQLRAAQREADEAEAAELAVNRDDELAAVRNRREALVAERAEVHQAELAEAHAEAAAELEAARREAAAIIASAAPRHTAGEPLPDPIASAAPPSVTTIAVPELAEAIAIALARVLEQRNVSFTAASQPVQRRARRREPARWRQTLHLDVVLSAAAALVAVVLLLAWMG